MAESDRLIGDLEKLDLCTQSTETERNHDGEDDYQDALSSTGSESLKDSDSEAGDNSENSEGIDGIILTEGQLKVLLP